MSRAREWLGGTAAHWNGDTKTWSFPSGATLSFGYLQKAGDEERYRTAEFQYIGVDELTRFPEPAYRFLFSRLRRLKGQAVPIRMRAATNPGGKGHEWVKDRFIADEFLRLKRAERFTRTWWKGNRLFVPAHRRDNPHLDQEDYDASLAELLPIVQAQLDEGDWSAHTGGHFREEWFRTFRDLGDAVYLEPHGAVFLKSACQIIIAVDPAGGTSEFADYTAMIVAAITPAGDVLVLDVVRDRLAIEEVVPRLADLCMQWGPHLVLFEEAFLQSAYVREARRTAGIPTLEAVKPGGQSKLVRATPAVIRAKNGQVYLPREAHWREAFLAEVCAFTGDELLDAHDDQVDALAYLVMAIDRFGAGSDHGPIAATQRRDPFGRLGR
jgi:predicted phage terminase large subunit-like protein